MSGVSQIVLMALTILAALLLMGFLIGRFFQSAKIRRRVMLGAVAVYLLLVMAYFGFIAAVLSGDLNSR